VQTIRGGYGWKFTDQTVLGTSNRRPGHKRRDGRSDTRHVSTAIAFLPQTRREGEACARRTHSTGGKAIISDEGVRGSSRVFRLRV
jgi:hypothetical protein